MQHTIPVEQLSRQVGPQIQAMAKAVESCVHCGFCLPVCPTYMILGEEMDSPRGRILLMKSVLEGGLQIQDTQPFIDRCLGCLACVTACPSGVKYGDLVMPFRTYAQGQVQRSMMNRIQHSLIQQTLPYPGRFRSAASLGKAVRPLRGVLPKEITSMLDMLPERLMHAEPLPALTPAEGTRRARVAFLTGCIQQTLAPEINRATLRVLAKNGVEVVIPQAQGCCGALSIHTGDGEEARRLARQNLRNFPTDVDAIITNAAGCGSGMKEYELLFKGQPDEEQALAFLHKAKDVSVFLVELGLIAVPELPQPLKIAYHDACHLAHAQGVTDPPRRLLRAIPNLTLLEIADGTTCCGSAGTYNIVQPEIASELGRRKVENILKSGADAVVMGNIGCMVQIRKHLDGLGRRSSNDKGVTNSPQSRTAQEKTIPVYHTMEIIEMAFSSISYAPA